MKTLGLVLLFACGAAQACSNRTHAQIVEENPPWRAGQEKFALATAATADYVAIGRVLDQAREIDQQGRRSVSMDKLSAVRGLPGQTAELYVQEQPPSDTPSGMQRVIIEVNCGPADYDRPRFERGFTYLVYVKDGRILRANLIHDFVVGMTGAEEVALLRGQKN